MVSHKQRLIDARKARVPLARVSAGYSQVERKAKRSSAVLFLGLMLPIVCAALVGVIAMAQVSPRPDDTAANASGVSSQPASAQSVLGTPSPVQLSVDRLHVNAGPTRPQPTPLPVAVAAPRQPIQTVPAAPAIEQAGTPTPPAVVARALPAGEPTSQPMSVGALTDASASLTAVPVPQPVEMDCIERTAEMATRTFIWFSVRTPAIAKEQRDPLLRLAETLSRCSAARLEIGGHADDGANPAENAQLSLQRAQAVAKILSSNGVQPSQISSVAYGASRPLTSSRRPQELARNRRVEFTVR